ncbi:MAG: TIGR02186 family protein [Deltaproteobacteria bacterium]|nr:TIGR02186 family protein [Deltaproteobacteria bacterium]
MSKKTLCVMVLVLVGMFRFPARASDTLPIELQVVPSEVRMGLSYNGVEVSISGEIPSGSEVLVRIMGKPEHQRLKKKGRALGLLWMNMGAVSIDNVPNVFLLYPSAALADFARSQPGQWRRLGLGFEALKNRVEILPSTEDKDTLFGEFVKLKEDAALYGTIQDAIHYKEKGGGEKSFTCVAPLPSNLPQDEFSIDVVAVKDGAIVARGTAPIRAVETGVTARLSSLAFNHGILYGVLAVLVAILAGLLTGVIFKGGKGAH